MSTAKFIPSQSLTKYIVFSFCSNKKVAFSEGTVDNEELNRKKSKCCCIYEKQKLFGESSDEDEGDGDCPDHCHGKKQFHKKPHTHNDKDAENGEPKQP